MTQEQAERLAAESIQRWGFVVVGNRPENPDAQIGKRTDFLWKFFKMPQPFVVLRRASQDEWSEQVRLFREMTGKDGVNIDECCPMVLVTD